MTKKRRIRCDECKELVERDRIEKRANPYILDIDGITEVMWLCDMCYDLLCDEI